VRRSLSRLAVLAAMPLALAGAASAPAAADPYLPPPGKVFAGVTGGREVDSFSAEVGRHPPVFQFFTHWDTTFEWIFRRAEAARARPMMHFSTDDGHRELIAPGEIAAGRGDGWLLQLNRRLDASGGVTYIRLMAEMDGHWNLYCAYDAHGRSRGPSHSTASFRAAWRRTVLIVRGGPVAQIDASLRALGLPPVGGADAPVSESRVLPRPRIAFLWVPQVAGAPDTRANSPRAYWPGAAYVDWVGTDFYSRYPNFRGLERFYRAFRGKPFAFGEWALWGRDDPAFVNRFFRWVRKHRRTRLVMYNQEGEGSPFRLFRYPRSRRAIRRQLQDRRFVEFAE
jgi:hypothetical protein